MIRLYGKFGGEHSLASVGRGFQLGLGEGVASYDLFPDFENSLDEAETSTDGADAEDAVFVGPLSHLDRMVTAGKHKRRWVMVTPNSTEVGAAVEARVNAIATHILTPSSWAASVLARIFPDKPILVVRHGIDPAYRLISDPASTVRSTPPKYFHMSSSDQERKGTKELLYAWKDLLCHEAELYISVPSASVYPISELAEFLGLSNVFVRNRVNCTPVDMARLYRQMDFVVQPSRGEGFGLVPLEARACGTPAILTTCTGHSEHAKGASYVPVVTGDLEPIDDLPNSLAPELKPFSILFALTAVAGQEQQWRERARMEADELAAEWSWENQLSEFRQIVREEA